MEKEEFIAELKIFSKEDRKTVAAIRKHKRFVLLARRFRDRKKRYYVRPNCTIKKHLVLAYLVHNPDIIFIGCRLNLKVRREDALKPKKGLIK